MMHETESAQRLPNGRRKHTHSTRSEESVTHRRNSPTGGVQHDARDGKYATPPQREAKLQQRQTILNTGRSQSAIGNSNRQSQ